MTDTYQKDKSLRHVTETVYKDMVQRQVRKTGDKDRYIETYIGRASLSCSWMPESNGEIFYRGCSENWIYI